MKNYKSRMRYAAMAFGRGRVMAAFDIGKARTDCQALYASVRAARERLAEHAQNGTGTQEELQALRDEIAQGTQRYDDMMAAIRMNEQQMADGVAAQFNRQMERREQGRRAAMGALYRSLMTAMPVDADVRAELSLPTTVTTGTADGRVLLPRTLSTEIIDDIVGEDDFLREISVTHVAGLELPTATGTDSADSAHKADGEKAAMAKIKAGTVAFGRIPYAKGVTVPSSLLDGTNTAISAYIDQKHYDFKRDHLLSHIFATSPEAGCEHMSVLGSNVGLATVTGATELDAILAALAALPARVRRVAKVAMTPAKWYALVRTLANGATTLFTKPDEAALGFKVVLCDYATTTLVGDLKTIHLNYDAPIQIERERHALERTTDIVLSTYYDIRVLQKDRLRLVSVAGAAAANEDGGEA
ncbi:MAG: phage major capsid protein [Clostridia bacterium]|nr:phage major capsid protein [Clostridia bacterium]